MDWLNQIFESSGYGGRLNGNWDDVTYQNPRHNSTENWMQDQITAHEREEIDYAIALSLSEEDQKGKFVLDNKSQSRERGEAARSNIQLEEDKRHAKAQLEEDEQLAMALQESLVMESPAPTQNDRPAAQSPNSFPVENRICTRCKGPIGHGRFLNCGEEVWHPECFRCNECGLEITDKEFSMSGNRPYHKLCYKKLHHPRCDICKNFIPANIWGHVELRAHPFWMQKYCPQHEQDGTPRCCSCERMEPIDMKYLSLDDGRKLCLECLDSAVVDTNECQPLYLEIREFFEGLNMKVDQQIPLLLVERPALNEAREGEKNGHRHLPETRGLCVSEEQSIPQIIRRPRIGAGFRFTDMITEPYKLIRSCEVTAILILYGLPRLLTGSILAHEMMHAWLRLKGYSNLSPEVEEGICQVLGHMWLDSEICSSSGSNAASSSSAGSLSPTSSKKGRRSDFERQLGEFFKHLIESDASPVYGQGFRSGDQAVQKYGLKSTLDHIKMTGYFPL